jgi:hypothetical protein
MTRRRGMRGAWSTPGTSPSQHRTKRKAERLNTTARASAQPSQKPSDLRRAYTSCDPSTDSESLASPEPRMYLALAAASVSLTTSSGWRRRGGRRGEGKGAKEG